MPADQLSATFSALADPTRRAILARLVTGKCSVTELAAPFKMSLPAVSKHLRVLKEAGLVEVQPRAQQRLYELRPQPLKELHQWLERYRQLWDARFGGLDELLEELKQKILDAGGGTASPTPTSS